MTAALLPITILNDLVSLGTAFAFGIVCLSVMYLRTSRPDMTRPFNVPLRGALAPRWAVVVGTTAIALILLATFTALFDSKWTGWGAAIALAAGVAWLALTWKARANRLWVGAVPILGIIGAVFMAEPLIEDITEKALRGDRIPATILVCYITLGALIYIGYGYSHSRLAKGLDVLDDGLLPSSMEAVAHGVHEG